MKSLRLFIRLSRPYYILSAILLYLLGIGIAHYLSGQVNWALLFLGLAWIIVVLLGAQYLNEYFDPQIFIENTAPKHTPFSGVSGAIGVGKLPRPVALWAGLAGLAVATALTVIIIQLYRFSLPGILIFGLILFGELFMALPPLRQLAAGYGELITSIIIGGLIPAAGYILQGHDFHRLLIMIAVPLTTLHIGMLLAMELPDYASDLKQTKQPVMVRVGWQGGMILHNIMILGSFVVIGIAFLFGLPIRVVWPVFFVFPIGLFQIWLMNRIADGAKPNWDLLVLVAASTFGVTAYLLTFAFWIH